MITRIFGFFLKQIIHLGIKLYHFIENNVFVYNKPVADTYQALFGACLLIQLPEEKVTQDYSDIYLC